MSAANRGSSIPPTTRNGQAAMLRSVQAFGAQPEGEIAMMSPHTNVALRYVRDEESARKAAHRPDAAREPDEQPSPASDPGAHARFRILARLHLTPPYQA